MFYSIFVRDGKLEYHVSQDREECEQGKSMSRRVTIAGCTNKILDDFQNGWIRDAEFYKATMVPYLGGQQL